MPGIVDTNAEGEHRRLHFAAGLYFVVLTVVMTWPLAYRLKSFIIGGIGDNYIYVWLIEWFKQALAMGHLPSYHVPVLNYPDGFNLAFTDMPVTMIMLGVPVSFRLGSVAGYNASLLISFFLSALGMYFWVFHHTRSVSAGMIAGSCFTVCAYRMSHIQGHLNLMGTQWMPFYFWFLTRLCRSRRFRITDVAGTALWLSAIAWTSQYYLYMTLLLTIPFVLLLLGFKGVSALIHRPEFGKHIFLLIVLLIAGIGSALWPYLSLSVEHHLKHTLQEVRSWSASVTDYVVPHPDHKLWGDWVKEHFGKRSCWVESTLYLGVVPAVLAVVSVIWGGRRREANDVRRALIGGALSAFILSLGTELHWLGDVVTWHGIEMFQLDRIPEGIVWLPGYFLFRYLPYYDGMRVWMRYGIFVEMFLCVLAGLAWRRLMDRRRSMVIVVLTILCLVLIGLDSWIAPMEMSPVHARPVDLWLAEQPGQGAVAQFPFWEMKGTLAACGVFVHHKPWICDPFGTFPTPQQRRLDPVFRHFPSRESIKALRELGVEWVIVDVSKYDHIRLLSKQLWGLGLDLKKRFGTFWIYRVRAFDRRHPDQTGIAS